MLCAISCFIAARYIEGLQYLTFEDMSICCEIVWKEILTEPVTIMFVIDISQGILALSNSAVFMLKIYIFVTCTFVSHASDTRYLFVYIRSVLTLTSDQLAAIQVRYESYVWHHQRDASHVWRHCWRHNGDGDRRTSVTFRFGRTILLYFPTKETQIWLMSSQLSIEIWQSPTV